MNISENLQILNTAKQDIKAAIIEKGQTVGDNMHEYADAIDNISGEVDNTDYLCFEAVEDSAVSLSNFGDNAPNIEYSYDKKTWTTWDYDNIDLPAGSKIYFRGDNPNGFSQSNEQYSMLNSSGNMSVAGNITTLEAHNGVRECKPWSFMGLFRNATAIIDASKLKFPVVVNKRGLAYFFNGCTNLVYGPSMEEVEEIICDETTGYNMYAMFQNCSSMIKGPTILKPTAAGYGSYTSLFDGCTSLVFAPYIKATSSVGGAYMFRNCSSLQYIKADFLAVGSGKTSNWVSGVASTGCFIKAKDATWTTKSISACPTGWTLITSVS